MVRVGLAAAGTLLAILLFLPVFPAPKSSTGERVGGASAIGALFSGRSGWDSKGYYSELVTLPMVGDIKPGATFTGQKLKTIFGSGKQYAANSNPWAPSPQIAMPGEAEPKPAKRPTKKPRKKSYGRGDVVSYTVSSISKSGTHATVSGTAVMRDGNTVSGSVYLEKVRGKWKVVGYGVG